MSTDNENETDKKVLQKCLLYIFNNIPIVPIKLSVPEFSKNEDISEINTGDLIFLMYSFIEGVAYIEKDRDFALNCFREFFNLIFNLNIDQNKLEENNDNKLNESNKKSMTFINRNQMYNEYKMYGNNTKSEVPLSLSYIWQKILYDGCDRSATIFLQKCIKENRSDYINWKDRNSMIRLIKFSVCRALVLYNAVENKKAIKLYKSAEEAIKMYNRVDDKIKGMKLFRIDGRISKEELKESEKYLNNNGVYIKNRNPKIYQINNGLKLCEKLEINRNERRDMLIRKNKPEMTLKEFASLALQNMKKRENCIEQMNVRNNETKDEFTAENEEIKRLQQSDEFNDSKSNKMGRIRRIG